jgi:hypothetical protein
MAAYVGLFCTPTGTASARWEENRLGAGMRPSRGEDTGAGGSPEAGPVVARTSTLQLFLRPTEDREAGSSQWLIQAVIRSTGITPRRMRATAPRASPAGSTAWGPNPHRERGHMEFRHTGRRTLTRRINRIGCKQFWL